MAVTQGPGAVVGRRRCLRPRRHAGRGTGGRRRTAPPRRHRRLRSRASPVIRGVASCRAGRRVNNEPENAGWVGSLPANFLVPLENRGWSGWMWMPPRSLSVRAGVQFLLRLRLCFSVAFFFLLFQRYFIKRRDCIGRLPHQPVLCAFSPWK